MGLRASNQCLDDCWPSSQEVLGSKAPYPANAIREASGRVLRGPRKPTIWRMVRLGARFGVPHSKGALSLGFRV